jgi:hypothetical protein
MTLKGQTIISFFLHVVRLSNVTPSNVTLRNNFFTKKAIYNDIG